MSISAASPPPLPFLPLPVTTSAQIYDPSPVLGLDVVLVFLLPRYWQIKFHGHTSPVPSKVTVSRCWGSIPILPVTDLGAGNGKRGSQEPGRDEFGTACSVGTRFCNEACCAANLHFLFHVSNQILWRKQFITIPRNLVFQNMIVFQINGFGPFEGRILGVTLTMMELLLSKSTIYMFCCHG